jgi:predicted glutamine amidotransferase/endogenous inhibitor of DNA gyrase (YacG/DUF329 family)
MCGIVGVVGTLALKDKTAFKELLIADTIRGPHSTGVCAIDGDKRLVYKQAVSASEFISQGTLAEITGYKYHTTAFIGHNRFASRGIISNANAHPFCSDHITLVHNGTLTNHYSLDHDADVDSEAITNYMSEHGVVDTAKELRGTFALVWHDADRSTINFLRNEFKPLHIAITASNIYWASEADMLRWVLGRNDIEIKEIFKLPAGEHLEIPSAWELGKWPIMTKEMLLEAATTVELAPKYSGQSVWNNRGGNTYQTHGTGKKNDTALETEEVDFVVNYSTDGYWGCTDLDTGRTYEISRVAVPELQVGKMYSGTMVNRATGFISGFGIEEILASGDPSTGYNDDIPFDADDMLDDEVIVIDHDAVTLGNLKKLIKDGCAYCSHPMSMEEALDGKFSPYGLMHDRCYDIYLEEWIEEEDKKDDTTH